MPKPTDYDKTHLRNMAAIGTRIDRIFKKAAEEAAKIGVSIKDLPEDRIFTFDDYPATQKQIERLMTALQQSMETTIVNGVRSSWTLSNNKNNALVSRIFGDRVGDLSKEQYKRYFSTNGAALEAFLQRKEQGLNLSDRVWRYTTAFKREIELGLDLGIRSGESAAKMTRSLRQYLQHPDKLFRRVRDKHGNLKLSKAAAEFHPGRGVYRSSYKNARRLAATETNIAYRTSDHLRWQQMDFVVGIEIKLSNNHTLNGVPLTDICDTLAGRYPKDFKFTGWHPHCRCKAIAILKTEDEMAEDTSRLLDGQQPTKGSVNTVCDVPAAFKDWIEERKDRIEMGGNLPYFVKDNRKRVDAILGHEPEVTKSPLEIAKERHEARTPVQAAAIQQAWNERRIANIQQAIADGYLPKECAEGLSSLPQEQFNDRIAFLQKRATAHAARTPNEIQAIKDAWEKRKQAHALIVKKANTVFKIADEYTVEDFTPGILAKMQEAIDKGDLNAMNRLTKPLGMEIKGLQVRIKNLVDKDILADIDDFKGLFSVSELEVVQAAIEKQLAGFPAKGFGDFSKDLDLANLQKLKESCVWQAKHAVKNSSKYATWEVAQRSWLKLADKAQDLIELHPIKAKLSTLQGFKTTSKEFKDLLDKAQSAATAGNKKMAQFYTQQAELKKNSLEAKRKGKTGGSGFDSDAYSQARKDAAMWAKTTKTADKQLRTKCGEVWRNATDAQRDAIYGYTQSYHNINEPLRGLTYVGSAAKTKEGLMRIPQIEAIIDKSTYDFDMWLQRGDGMVALKKFGLANWQTATEADIMKLVGAEGVEGAFWSAGVAKGKGFSGDIIFNIYAPKGTKAMYCEPFSAFGHGSGRGWDGIAGQSSFGHESEILIQRGTKFRITKIERSGGTYYIDVEIIEQKPVAFPYVGGYPFK